MERVRVQHKFLRVCAVKSNFRISDHDAIESQLNLPPSRERRNIFGLAFLFKIVNGIIECPSLLSGISLNVPYYFGLRYPLTFNIPFHRTSYGVNSPIDRYLSMLNNLNLDIFNMGLAKFKTNCKNVMHVP